MRRDFIVVFGAQGFGKSVWTKAYAAPKKRLLVFDPLASYAVDFSTDPEIWLRDVIHGRRREFRFGTWHAEEMGMFGNAAYAAGDCTLIIEECALMFQRGENLADWAKPLIFMGRHRAVNLVLVAQRATSIPIAIRSQATRVVSFLQTEPDDVRALSERIGSQWRDEISALPELHCLDWQPGRPVERYRVTP